MDANTKWRTSLDERRPSRLVEMLAPDFLHDLQTASPDQPFETYGTHCIASASIGGRADVSSTSEATEGTPIRKIDLAVTSQYNTISVEARSEATWSDTFKNAKTRTSLRVLGGNGFLFMQAGIKKAGITKFSNRTGWTSSITCIP